jgi:hypothetical protein
MNPSVRLMVCLLSLYGAAMVMFWYGIAGHKPAAREETAGRLALKAGQTIGSCPSSLRLILTP